MDADRFDTLTRSLTEARSRRGAVAALLGGTLGLLGLAETAAKNKKKGKGKKGKGKKNKKKDEDNTNQNPGAPPDSCANSVKDGGESDVDCGGGTCPRCAIDKTCVSRNDCASGRCVGAKCAVCVAAADCGTDTDGNMCACRDHESGQRFCSKQNAKPDRVFPAGTPCTVCQGGEQCFPINGGANGIECIPPCGAP
jgi:hypothetical protein